MSQNTSQTITIKVHNKDSIIATHKATSTPDNPTVITAQAGMNYELVNDLTNFAPENIKIKRVGNDLQLAFEDSVSTTFDPDLIIKDYYQYAEGDSPENTSTIIGMHENGSLYPYAPEAGLPDQAAPMLAQEVVAGQALGGGAITSSTQSNAIYWLAGLLVAGGLAAAGGGGGGNSAPQPPSDTTRPDKPIIDSLGTTNINKPTITGTAEPNSIITVVIKDSDNNTVDTGTTQTDGKGNWSYTPKTELPDGDNTVGATATDEAGNKSDEATTGVTIDTVSPELTVDDSATNDTTPTITGSVSEEATVHVIIKDKNGNVLDEGKATVNTDGTWSYTPTKELPEGEHTVEVTAEDKAGNKGSSQESLVLDTSVALPTITVVEDNDNNLVLDSQEIGNKTEVTATVAVPENAGQGDQIVITDGNGNPVSTLTVGTDVAAGGNTTIQVPINEDGSKVEIHVSVKDAVGNTDSSSTVLTINASSPVVKLIGDRNNDHVFNKEEVGTDNQIAVEITIPRDAQVGDVVTVTGNDTQELAQWTVGTDVSAGETKTTAISVDETTTHIKVTATINNNTGSDEADVDLVAPGDTDPGTEGIEEAPSISIAEATDGYINYKELYGTDDNPAGIQTTVTLPTGTKEGDTLTLTFNQGSETITLAHTVTAAEAESKSVALDILATGNNANASDLDYTVVNAESYTLKDGDYTVTALVTDKAGNPGKDSSPVGFTVDTRPVGDDTTAPQTDGQADNAPTVEIAEAKDNGFINKYELNNGISVKVTFPTGDNIEPAKAGDTVTLTFKKNGQEDIIHSYTITSADATNGSAEITVPKSSTVADHAYNFTDGGYTLTAVITDKAGNEGIASTPSQDKGTIFTIDTTANVPELEQVTSLTSSKVDEIFNTAEAVGNKVTLKVTAPDDAQAGETIAVIVNGKTVKTLTVGNDIPVQGSTNLEISLNNTDTHVDVKAVFTDQANNTATSATLSAGVDLVAPKVAINSITTSDTTPTITGTVDDETATVKVTINSNGLDTEITGTATVKADGAWSYIVPNASALSNGTYTVAATATDTAGNIGNANQNGTLTLTSSSC